LIELVAVVPETGKDIWDQHEAGNSPQTVEFWLQRHLAINMRLERTDGELFLVSANLLAWDLLGI
jgi:hypothetical protein